MKKSIIFFAAIAAFFSCSKENPVNEIPAEETFSVELFASAPSGDADTKTTLVDGDGTKFVHWSKGDAIKVLFFPKHLLASCLCHILVILTIFQILWQKYFQLAEGS